MRRKTSLQFKNIKPVFIKCLLDFLGPIPEDLYKLTGYKNPYNWILYSQKMTGSHPHSDPDLTGAWNYLISGRKYWVILPTGKIRLSYIFS